SRGAAEVVAPVHSITRGLPSPPLQMPFVFPLPTHSRFGSGAADCQVCPLLPRWLRPLFSPPAELPALGFLCPPPSALNPLPLPSRPRALYSALFTFPNEYRMLKKERPAGMYRLSAYYAARTASDLPIELLYPTVFVTIIYWMGGLRPTAGAFFCNLFSMLLVVLLAQTWGLLFGGTFMDPKMAQTITTVAVLLFLLVGGFYVKKVPVWIGWLKYLSFIYWVS
ncbi:hypothetical protein Vafri_2304, partial [Volvox africanus]